MANAAVGIDVSHHQGRVDWNRVGDSGISFAFCKATDGLTSTDPTFKTNWKGMYDASIIRGPYHYFRAGLDAAQQARHFSQVVGEILQEDMPPVLDLEDRDGVIAHNVSNAALINAVRTWISVVEDKLGVSPMIYTDPSFWREHMNSSFGDYPLWIAHTNVSRPTIPAGWKTYTFWQYSFKGHVPGITPGASVDLDRFNGSIDDLMAFLGVQDGGPASAGSVTPPPDSAATQTYIIKTGDTLYSIARHFGTSVDSITKANHITDPTKIRVGQILHIA